MRRSCSNKATRRAHAVLNQRRKTTVLELIPIITDRSGHFEATNEVRIYVFAALRFLHPLHTTPKHVVGSRDHPAVGHRIQTTHRPVSDPHSTIQISPLLPYRWCSGRGQPHHPSLRLTLFNRFINNEFVQGKDEKKFESINPATEKPIVAVCEATEKDVDIAVDVARKTFEGPWRQVTPEQRGIYLTKLADLFERDIDVLASIEALDNGKALNMAKVDIQLSIGCLRYYGGWADKIEGKVIERDTETFNFTRQEPIGVCAQIIPWNFPVMMWAWKIAPAVATGNTVVIKTAEQTPLGGLYAASLVKEAGFPPGVINVISGFGKIAGAALSAHMDVDKIAFTGSTVVGRQIMKAAAGSNLKKVTLELGGKSPNIVFNDADIDNAISWVNFGIFYNHGQCCCAGSRIYVQEGIYDKFVEKFKERAQKNIVGDPFKEETFQGPQVSDVQFKRIME